MRQIFIHISAIIVLSTLLFVPIPSLAVQTTISFDEPSVSTPSPQIGVRYSNSGVLLPESAQIIPLTRSFPSKAHSDPNVLISRAWHKEFDPDPLIIEFTYSVQAVTLYTGVPWDTRGKRVYATLEAFDDNGKTVNLTESDLGVGPTDINIPMQVVAPQMQHIIKKIKLDDRYEKGSGLNDRGSGLYEFIDDLSLTSEGKPPVLANEPPNVKITSPIDGSMTDIGHIKISGEIYGDGLFPEWASPELKISWPIESGSTLPSSYTDSLVIDKDLFWTQQNQALSFSRSFQLSHFGKNTIIVTASNAKGIGSAQTSITYLPKAISDKYSENGGLNVFGDFVWGETIGSCNVAIYQGGAIFSYPDGRNYSVLGKIFNKWKSLAGPSSLGRLGCAIDEKKAVLGGIAQDFVGGRIYSGSKGEYYVIEPFRDAIDKLDFINNSGLPVTDPVKQSQQLLPILWQKFERTIGNINLVSTMEVTDNPLTLWIATPDIEGVERVSASITSRISTVWRSFPCNQKDAPCQNVEKPQPTKKLPYSDLEKVSNYGHYPSIKGASQWPSIAQNKIISSKGNIKSTGLSGTDAPFNHACSTSVWSYAGVDWCTEIVPDTGFEGILGEKQDALEIEYEWCLVGYPTPKDPNDPSKGSEENLKPGDKLFVAGRWISDAGCHPFPTCSEPYKSEIHPPTVILNMYTGERQGKPATIGDLIYFDWWYSGETVEVDIYPPPRPQADANLVVEIPLWNSMCLSDAGKCGIQVSEEPKSSQNHIRLKISGRPDIPFNTPPKEDNSGQLFHGYFPEEKLGRLVAPPTGFEHMVSLWGDFVVRWDTP
jgi:hypothetical protein